MHIPFLATSPIIIVRSLSVSPDSSSTSPYMLRHLTSKLHQTTCHFLNIRLLVMPPGLCKGCYLCVSFSLYCSRETPIHPSKPTLEVPYSCFLEMLSSSCPWAEKKYLGLKPLIWRRSSKCYFPCLPSFFLYLYFHSILNGVQFGVQITRQLIPPLSASALILR